MVRIKNRYLLVNILYPELEKSTSGIPDVVIFNQPTTGVLTASLLQTAIQKEVQHLFGDYGGGAIKNSLKVKYLSPTTSTFILKTSREHHRLVWAALCFMDRVPVSNGKRCVFRVARVSGTIRKAQEEAVRRAREVILRAQREGEGEGVLEVIFGAGGSGREAEMGWEGVDGSEGEDEGGSDSDG